MMFSLSCTICLPILYVLLSNNAFVNAKFYSVLVGDTFYCHVTGHHPPS